MTVAPTTWDLGGGCQDIMATDGKIPHNRTLHAWNNITELHVTKFFLMRYLDGKFKVKKSPTLMMGGLQVSSYPYDVCSKMFQYD